MALTGECASPMSVPKIPKTDSLSAELDLKVVRIFIAVAKAGSFVAGGASVGLTRSAAGKAVTRLESYLNTRLFHRTTRKLSLTPEGEEFFNRCLQIIENIEEAEASVRQDAQSPRGILKLTVSEGYGKAIIIPFLGQFLSAHPRLKVEVSFTDRLVDLAEEGLDLAIRVGDGHTSTEYISRVIERSRPRLFASASYLATWGTPGTIAELEHHRRLLYGLGIALSRWKFTDKQGNIVSTDGNQYLRFDSGDAIRIAATEGLGIGLLPNFIVERELQQGRLLEVLPEISAAEIAVNAIYPSRKYLPARVRVSIDELLKYIATPPALHD